MKNSSKLTLALGILAASSTAFAQDEHAESIVDAYHTANSAAVQALTPAKSGLESLASWAIKDPKALRIEAKKWNDLELGREIGARYLAVLAPALLKCGAEYATLGSVFVLDSTPFVGILPYAAEQASMGDQLAPELAKAQKELPVQPGIGSSYIPADYDNGVDYVTRWLGIPGMKFAGGALSMGVAETAQGIEEFRKKVLHQFPTPTKTTPKVCSDACYATTVALQKAYDKQPIACKHSFDQVLVLMKVWEQRHPPTKHKASSARTK